MKLLTFPPTTVLKDHENIFLVPYGSMRIIAFAIMIPSLVPNELPATRLVPDDEIFAPKVIGLSEYEVTETK